MRREALVLVPLVLGLTGCALPKEKPAPAAVVNNTTVTLCPRPVVPGVPADLPFADRETLNLGDGLIGHKLVWQRTQARRVVVTVGGNPLDALEDLDMKARDVVIGGKAVSLSTTLLQPGLEVLEVPAQLPPDCGALFVLAERLTRAELDAVVRTLTVVAPTPGEGPG